MVRAGAPNMLPWVMRDGRAAYVSAARVANGAPGERRADRALPRR